MEFELYKIFCSKPGSYLWAEMQVIGCMRDFDIRHQGVSLSLSVNHLEELLMSFSARNSPHLRRDGEFSEILNSACIQCNALTNTLNKFNQHAIISTSFTTEVVYQQSRD